MWPQINEIKTEQINTSLCSASCVNATVLAFAGDRWIAISRPPGPQQQTRRTPLLRSIVGTDRQVDRRTNGHLLRIRPRTTVSVGALHPGLQCWHAAASAFRQPSSTCRTAFQARHLRLSDVLSCWPDGLELTPRFYPRSNEQHRLF